MAGKAIDLTGKTFHRLTVLHRSQMQTGLAAEWVCVCECGNETTVSGVSLRANKTKSCGCFHREVVGTKGRGSYVDTSEIKRRVQEKHGDTIAVLSEYVDWSVKMDFQCTQCDGVWQAKPQNVCNGSRCPDCGRKASGAVISDIMKTNTHAQKRTKANIRALNKHLPDSITWKGNPTGTMSELSLHCDDCKHDFKRQVRHILSTDKLCPVCHDTTHRQMLNSSPIANRWLDEVCGLFGIELQRETQIPGTLYRADGFNPQSMTVFEFHGDNWHGNPNVYHADDQCHPFKPDTAAELYARTLAREEELVKLGYNVVSVWESDYRKGKLISNTRLSNARKS